MTPSVARVVHWQPFAVGSAPWPAIVTEVKDGGVLVLAVLAPGSSSVVPVEATEGTDPGQWSWPPRV